MSELEMLCSFQEEIGYNFNDPQYLKTALTHSSYANEYTLHKIEHNERMEFLGDAVLEIISSELLYREYPDLPEGKLSRKRASLVCEPALAYCAREIGLGKYLLLGHGERLGGGSSRDSILSDALEAVIGAIYLDGGLEEARRFVMRFVLNDIERSALFTDSKTLLQELIQKDYKEQLVYEQTGATGPEHNRTFFVDVKLGERVIGSGSGRTLKAAGQDAAYQAIKAINRKQSNT